jgi:putative transcriptional regulator
MKRHCRTALFALLVLAAGAHAQSSPTAIFLVARPGMPDPNFRESVVLVVQSERAETTGVIINRPTNRSLAELLPSERFEHFTDPIFFGGPVAPQGLFALFQSAKYSGPAVPMLPGIYLAVLPDSVDALVSKPPEKMRFFSGYSGWAPGQLQAEIERGDWPTPRRFSERILRASGRTWCSAHARCTPAPRR